MSPMLTAAPVPMSSPDELDPLTRLREADGADLREHLTQLDETIARLPENSALRVVGRGVQLLDRAIAELRADIERAAQDSEQRIARINESVSGLLAREVL